MSRLRSVRSGFRPTDSGAALVEYALLVALIAVGHMVASSLLGNAISWAVAPRP
jgi:Flp pilus assembly pilin Flp